MDEMTPKQRLLASIKGEKTDRVPFSPFLAYYFDYLPEDVRAKGDRRYLEEMGADPLFRGAGCAYGVQRKNCSSSERYADGKRYVTFSTPKGDFYAEYTYAPAANTWFITKHPIEDEDGLMLLKAFYEDVEIVSNVKGLNRAYADLGENGLMLPIMGTDCKSSFQGMIETWVGTENLAYLCEDCPDTIKEVLEVMYSKSRMTAEMSAQSDADAFISWEDSSTTNVSPQLYNEYIAPEISDWCKILGNSGKVYVQHACGHVKDLLLPMAAQGICAVESVSPPPTGNVTMEQTAAILPQNVAVIGGIEPVQMLNSPLDELLEYAKKLIKMNKNRGFVLSNSDSCPPYVEYEKFTALAKLVKEFN